MRRCEILITRSVLWIHNLSQLSQIWYLNNHLYDKNQRGSDVSEIFQKVLVLRESFIGRVFIERFVYSILITFNIMVIDMIWY